MVCHRSLKASKNEQKLQAAFTNMSKGKFKTTYAAAKAHETLTAILYRRPRLPLKKNRQKRGRGRESLVKQYPYI